jgi:putative ABC transport system permease protein
MKIIRLILKEIAHRRFNFLLSVFAVVTAVALFVFFFTTADASRRETSRLMRDMGYNLRIIHRETDMNRFWADGFSGRMLPEECVGRFAGQDDIFYNHLLAILRGRITWRGRDLILSGIASEVAPAGKKKSSMIFAIEPGTLYAGFEIARDLDLRRGAVVDLSGKPFRVAECLRESGSEEDVTVTVALKDAQVILGQEGKINEIRALECLCPQNAGDDSLGVLSDQLERLVPEGRVIQIKNIATARRKQRRLAEEYGALLVPFVLSVCAVWICVLAVMNVRERRREIGVLRALGHGSGRIAALFLGKALGVGLAGAAVGFAAGTLLAEVFGPDVFVVTARSIEPDFSLLGWALGMAPLFAALSSLIPAMLAVTQDPAETLREE